MFSLVLLIVDVTAINILLAVGIAQLVLISVFAVVLLTGHWYVLVSLQTSRLELPCPGTCEIREEKARAEGIVVGYPLHMMPVVVSLPLSRSEFSNSFVLFFTDKHTRCVPCYQEHRIWL